MYLRRFDAVVLKPLKTLNAAVRCGGSAAVVVVARKPLVLAVRRFCGGCVPLIPHTPYARARGPEALARTLMVRPSSLLKNRRYRWPP